MSTLAIPVPNEFDSSSNEYQLTDIHSAAEMNSIISVHQMSYRYYHYYHYHRCLLLRLMTIMVSNC